MDDWTEFLEILDLVSDPGAQVKRGTAERHED